MSNDGGMSPVSDDEEYLQTVAAANSKSKKSKKSKKGRSRSKTPPPMPVAAPPAASRSRSSSPAEHGEHRPRSASIEEGELSEEELEQKRMALLKELQASTND